MVAVKVKGLVLALVLLLVGVVPVAADTTYTIQRGDTLAAIARRYDTTVQALAQANNIVNPNLIYAGQVLIIPGSDTPAPPPSAPPATGSTTYTVQRGDTLFRIAARFDVTVQAMVQANGLSNANFIYVGQVLTIPGGAGSPPPATPAPVPTQPPTPPATPAPSGPPIGANLLPNPSFEEGWYNQNGIPELQLPNHWIFEWDEGSNPFDSAPWSAFVRPEARVLSEAFLPADERAAFIWDGRHTVKIFKGNGALSYRLMTDVSLQPGTYVFEINIFPDLVSGYDGGNKVWASDPYSGEVRFIVDNGGSGWLLPAFGQRNTLTHTFTVNAPRAVRVGVAVRGRYALPNNGWFMDNWSLKRLQN